MKNKTELNSLRTCLRPQHGVSLRQNNLSDVTSNTDNTYIVTREPVSSLLGHRACSRMTYVIEIGLTKYGVVLPEAHSQRWKVSVGDQADARLVLTDGEFAGDNLSESLLKLEVAAPDITGSIHHKHEIQSDWTVFDTWRQ